MPDNSGLFIMLTDYNAKNTEIEGENAYYCGLVTTAASTAVENEIPERKDWRKDWRKY